MLANDSVTLAVEVPIWLTPGDISALEREHRIKLRSETGRPTRPSPAISTFCSGALCLKQRVSRTDGLHGAFAAAFGIKSWRLEDPAGRVAPGS
jgi:hypothetical protein